MWKKGILYIHITYSVLSTNLMLSQLHRYILSNYVPILHTSIQSILNIAESKRVLLNCYKYRIRPLKFLKIVTKKNRLFNNAENLNRAFLI